MPEFDQQSVGRITNSVQFTERLLQNTLPVSLGGHAAPLPGSMIQVRVRNKTGSALAVGTPVLLKNGDDGQAASDVDFRTGGILWAITATGQSSQSHIGVVFQPIDAEGVGIVTVGGITSVWAVINDANHSSVMLAGNTFVSSTSGFPIISWKTQTATGVIQLGPQYVQILLSDKSQTTGSDVPIIYIQNMGGLPLTNRQIVGIGPPLVYPTTTFPTDDFLPIQPAFQSIAPNALSPFAIVLGGVSSLDVVTALTVGIIAVKVNYTDATHSCATVLNGNYVNLTSAVDGPAQILWRQFQAVAGNGTFGIQWTICSVNQRRFADPDDYRGYSYTAIAAATGTKDQPLTPGTGLAKLYTRPTAGAAGTPWQVQSSPVVAENWMRSAIAINKPILLRPSRKADDGSQIYTVITEGCTAFTSG